MNQGFAGPYSLFLTDPDKFRLPFRAVLQGKSCRQFDPHWFWALQEEDVAIRPFKHKTFILLDTPLKISNQLLTFAMVKCLCALLTVESKVQFGALEWDSAPDSKERVYCSHFLYLLRWPKILFLEKDIWSATNHEKSPAGSFDFCKYLRTSGKSTLLFIQLINIFEL